MRWFVEIVICPFAVDVGWVIESVAAFQGAAIVGTDTDAHRAGIVIVSCVPVSIWELFPLLPVSPTRTPRLIGAAEDLPGMSSIGVGIAPPMMSNVTAALDAEVFDVNAVSVKGVAVNVPALVVTVTLNCAARVVLLTALF